MSTGHVPHIGLTLHELGGIVTIDGREVRARSITIRAGWDEPTIVTLEMYATVEGEVEGRLEIEEVPDDE